MSNPLPSSKSMADLDGLTIRTCRDEDHAQIWELYHHGLLAGQIAPNDTAADLDHIHAAYFDSDRHHFWVAELGGRLVGMIGVGSDDRDTAEVRRLRVAKDYQSSAMASELLQTALNHCRHHMYLKVRLDTRFEEDQAVDMFDKVGFQHTRTRTAPGKDMLEFYFDLYRDPSKDGESQG